MLKNLDGDWSVKGADPKKPTTINFNLCHYTATDSCGSNKEDNFAYRTDDSGNCEMLTSEAPQAEITDTISRDDPSDGSEQTGIRLLRAGGDVCPSDDTKLLSFTIDVYCNSDVMRNPSQIKSLANTPDDDSDPCNVYVQLEHAAGCPELDFQPALDILGAIMIFAGVTLQYFGRSAQRMFMRLIVSIVTFIIVMVCFFKLNWLALFDPTEPDQNKSVFLTFLAVLVAIIATVIVNWIFKKFLRFAPTFIGAAAGFWFSIYFIAAINGVGGMFTE